MNRTRHLRGECSHCNGLIDFPADSIGMITDCPHCGQPTELMLSAPTEEPTVPTRLIVWTVLAAAILVLGLIGSFAALKRAKKLAAGRQKANPPALTNTAPAAPPTPEDFA